MCLPVSLPSKMLMSLFSILSPKKHCQVYGLIGHRAIICWSKIFQNPDRSPIDGGFELFEYAKLPTGFYQSREMTGKAPSCRDNSASFFQRGVTKHFSLEYTGNEALDDNGDFKWDCNERDVGTHAVPFNQTVVSGSFRWVDFQEENRWWWEYRTSWWFFLGFMYHGFIHLRWFARRCEMRGNGIRCFVSKILT